MRLSRKSLKVVFVTVAMGFLYFGMRGLPFLTIHAASSADTYNKITEYQTVTSILLSIVYLVWVACYLIGGRLSQVILGTGLWLMGIILVVLILPQGIKTDIVISLNQINIQAKLQDIAHQIILKSWQVLRDLLIASVIGCSLYVAYRRYHRGNRTVGIMFVLAMVLSLVALLINLYANSDLVDPELAIPITSITLVGVISFALVTEIIQTKNELHQYKQQLELLVDLRTADLGHTNTRLKKRISYLEKVAALLRKRESSARALLDTSPEMAVLMDLDGKILDINQNGAKQLGLDADQAKGKVIFQLLDKDQVDSLQAGITEINVTNHPVQWEEKRFGRDFGYQLHPIQDNEGSVIGLSQFKEDITGRVSFESDMHKHIADLDILNQVIDLITGNQDINTALLSVSEIITERFNACSTYMLIASDEIEGATVLQGFDRGKGPIKPVVRKDLNLRSTQLVQDNVLNKKSIMVTDISSPAIPAYIQQLMVCEEIQNTMLLPLCIHGEIKGLVTVCRVSAIDQFNSEDTKFAEAVATHVARAIEYVSNVETIKEKAVREERDRLAREMHDSVTQTIYSASLITEVLPNIWDRNPEEGKRNLIKVRHLVQGALAEIRTILFELRPSALEMANLETLLRQLGVAISGRERIHVQMSTEGDVALPLNVKTTIYRIAQEAFNNIAKHSDATQVQTILKLRSEGLTLNIADNGKGFLLSQASSKGMGLRIMQERAALIGARIDIDSEPMEGTNVNITWGNNHVEMNYGA